VIVGTLRVWLAGPLPEAPVSREVDDLPELLTESAQAVTEQEERKRRLEPGETLDPNRASEIQLDRLPGVGPSLAKSIVEYREREGAFTRAPDLLAVRGFGQASLARIGPLLDFGAGLPRGLGSTRRSPRISEDRVALNSASLEDLVAIPGIGPVLAQRILTFRSERGRFSTVDGLLDVSGIGPATLERIRTHILVRGRKP